MACLPTALANPLHRTRAHAHSMGDEFAMQAADAMLKLVDEVVDGLLARVVPASTEDDAVVTIRKSLEYVSLSIDLAVASVKQPHLHVANDQVIVFTSCPDPRLGAAAHASDDTFVPPTHTSMTPHVNDNSLAQAIGAVAVALPSAHWRPWTLHTIAMHVQTTETSTVDQVERDSLVDNGSVHPAELLPRRRPGTTAADCMALRDRPAFAVAHMNGDAFDVYSQACLRMAASCHCHRRWTSDTAGHAHFAASQTLP